MGKRGKVVPFKRPFKAAPLPAVRRPPPLRFWDPAPPTWRQSLRRMRPWLAVIALLTIAGVFWVYDRNNRLPPLVEQVGEPFTRCGYGRGFNCVVDGDTFRIGERTIRVAGIDAAELAGECREETARAETSTRALQDWLNRGPFEMASDPAEPVDRYGRELMTVTRSAPGGRTESLASYMAREGGARGYFEGPRGGWC